jgi:STE24 endopeptidase
VVAAVRRRGVRIGLAAVAMVLVAEAAVWLLRPREDPPLDPAPVSADEYFKPGQIERAREYREGQRWLVLAALGAQGVVLGAFALGRPRPVRRALDRLAARPLAGAAAAGLGLWVAIELAALPPRLWAHERAVDVGLSTQATGGWLADAGKSAAIAATIAAAATATLLALVRRFPRAWWVPASAAATALAATFAWLAPVVLAPLFNRFEALPPGAVRSDVLALAERAGVDVGEVYRVDASRRVTSLNAYVGGLGPTKRVVLYDNLIERTERPELRSVVAHELGHVAHSDVPRGIAFVALSAPLGFLFVREAGLALARRSGVDGAVPAAVPAYLLALGVASLVLTVPGNQLSREVEASADRFALELTDDPDALIDLQRRLAVRNLSDPDPPEVVSFLLSTHPSAVDRIGTALAFERSENSR